jgi:5-carboxymethyl-2-hydroxymuconate isomerase
MPHTTLEYTASVAAAPDLQRFWEDLHRFLVEAAPCGIQDIKSRAYRCEDFRMADGREGLAFAHLSILLMEGRDEATLAKVGQGALALLRQYFSETLARREADLTVEIRGMRRDCYFKTTSVKAP